ncbi:protein kinase domain-containing protein [Haliangium sp.]|uniref:nSTAND1 domain-containing NTPase n=1 Tax=Haliangium sp. TaxID=2663208 RepID=UPI003D10C066
MPTVEAADVITSPGLPAIPPRPASGRMLGDYELIRPLGTGSIGIVYLARDLRRGCLVAIKVLSVTSAGVGQRLAELQPMLRMSHPNIVVTHDIGEHAVSPYIVTEYIAGQPLDQWLRERGPGRDPGGPLTPAAAIDIALPVARALAHAHAHGVVHRNVKPGNIMITEAGVVKVLDFGIALLREAIEADDKASALLSTMPGAVIRTLPYMSPEQLEGLEVDERADVWALGIVLFEMVTGSHPTLAGRGDGVSAALSPAALFDIADPEQPMPSAHDRRGGLGRLGDVIDRCLVKDRVHRTRSAQVLVAELEAVTLAGRGHPGAREQNPFPGLAAYQVADADRFFGRDGDIAELLARLRTQPLVIVTGPAGTGKSSLVRAGVVAALERSGEGWDPLIMRPGRRPLRALAELVSARADRATAAADRSGGEPGAAALASHLRDTPGHAGAVLRAWAMRRRRRALLFVDQFEELYTLGADAGVCAAFTACLEGIADDPASPLRVILSVRSDYLDRMAEDGAFMRAVGRGLYFLSPLDRDSLRRALVRPTEASGYVYEDPAVVDDMLAAAVGQPGNLPLLSFAASSLWERRDRERHLLTRAAYQAMGGVAEALARHADGVLASMNPSLRARVRAVFERLVTTERARDIVTLGELRRLPGGPEQIEQVVRVLVEAGLLRLDAGDEVDAAGAGGAGDAAARGHAGDAPRRDRRGDQRRVEIAHESLTTAWPTLAQWLDEGREDVAFRARLGAAAATWDRGGRDQGLVWRGEQARAVQAWRRRNRGPVGRREQAYLDAVYGASARATLRRRALVVGLVAVLVALLLVSAAGLARLQRAEREARRQADELAAVAHALEQALARESAARETAEVAQRAADEARWRAEVEAERARQAVSEAQAAQARPRPTAAPADRAAGVDEPPRFRVEGGATQAHSEDARAPPAPADTGGARTGVIPERAVGDI